MAEAAAVAEASDAAAVMAELTINPDVAALEESLVTARTKLLDTSGKATIAERRNALEEAQNKLYGKQTQILLSKSGITPGGVSMAIDSFQQYAGKINVAVVDIKAGTTTIPDAAKKILSDLDIPEDTSLKDAEVPEVPEDPEDPEDPDSQVNKLKIALRWQKAALTGVLKQYKDAILPSGDQAVNAWQASVKQYAKTLEEKLDPTDPDVIEAKKKMDDASDNVKSELKASNSALKKTKIPTKLAVFTAVSSLSMLTLTAFFIIECLQDEGCWQYVNGVKDTKVIPTTFNYYDSKQNFCSCGPGGWGENSLDDFTMCPVESGKTTPTGGNKPDPVPSTGTYPPCISSTYPVCDVKSDGSGIYYGYYHVTATGIMNTLLNKGKEIIKTIGSGFGWLVKIIVVVISILICLFLIVKGLIDKNWLYGGGALIVAGIGTGGYIYL